jgi:hypothetical protein
VADEPLSEGGKNSSDVVDELLPVVRWSRDSAAAAAAAAAAAR